MMRLRVVCPRQDGDAAQALLESSQGVVHLTRAAGAGLHPAGDLIEAVVAEEVAQDVVDALVGQGVDRYGEISLQPIELILSQPAETVRAALPADSDHGVVWDELLETTGEEAELTATYLVFMTIACLLAAVGVITGSAVTIVGAMVVSPDFGPLAALAVAAVGGRRDLAARAGVALGVGFPVAIAATAVFAVLLRSVGWVDPGSLVELGDVAFVYRVGPYSVIVALLAGTAGMLALTSRKSGALIGVFISVTTVPAAGYAALTAVNGDWSRCAEAVLQLVLNLTGVVVAAVVTLWLRRHRVHPAPSST